jgi:hypothetical protein
LVLQDLRLLGQAQHGIYDETDDIDPILLHRFYGAGPPTSGNDKDGNPTLEDCEDHEEPNPDLEDFGGSSEEDSGGGSDTNVGSSDSENNREGENSEDGTGGHQNYMVVKVLRG